MPARHRPASQFSSSRTPDTYGLTGKKIRGEGHVGVEPHDMQNRVKKTMSKSCHANMQNRAKNHVKIMSCKHAKTMQKPCKNHATCGAYAGVYTGQVARQGGFYAGRRGNPLNIHSPRVPCYMCYMCYISQGKPLNIHSPRVPCYMCYMCYISQGKPLNIHSPRVPCYMYYMCYMALYSTYTTDFARTEHIAHIVHIARSRGRVGVQRLGV